MLRCIGCILVSVCLFAPLAVWLYPSPPLSPADHERLARLFVNPEVCQPEPGERAAFLAGLVVLPAGLLVCTLVCRRLEERGCFRLPAPLVGILDLGCAALVLAGCWYVTLEADWYHLRRNLFFQHPGPLLAVTALLLAALRWPGRWSAVRLGGHLLVLGLVALLFLASIFDEGGINASSWHFDAVFDPVVRVHFGRALLLDAGTQYGLYPQLLQPLFALIGLSVTKFTVIMGLLTAGSFLALWVFLSQATRNPLAALLGFLALVFASWAYSRTPEAGERTWMDLYFQSIPIRFVFPAALVLLAWRYFCRPGWLLYWSTTGLLSVGVLWNLDTGLPALLSWVATLCYAELFSTGGWARVRKVGLHLAASALVLAGVVALYSAAVYLGYGGLPHLAEALHYQRLFYGEGFYMLPLPLPGTWVLVLLVYLAGLASAASALLPVAGAGPQRGGGRGCVRVNMIFLLSVLGTGLFSYYQGRSHSLVLPLVWWPVWLLLALFLDELASRLRAGSWRLLHWLAAAGVVGVLAGYAGIALVDLRFLGEWVHGQLPGTQASAAVRREAACLRSITPPGEGMLILSGRGGILHLLSGVPPVSRSSYVGMLLLDDYAELSRVLEERPTVQVFIEKSVFYLDWACNIGHRLLIDSIQQRYELVEEMEDGYLFRRANFLLRGGGRSLCQIRSRDGRVPRGLVSDVLTLGSAFTVEVLVKPEAEEALWATVIGNQSLWVCNTGFVIQQQARNVYVAVLGNGVGWEVGPGFQLAPGRWHYLALVVQQKAVQVYVDGRLAATYGRTAPWPGASGQPVYVGNWFGEDRPFKGLIKEARVVDRAVPMSEVVSRYECIKPQLRWTCRAREAPGRGPR